MTKKISLRKMEALSAYLDGELSQGARRRLETNLEQDAVMRAALEDMRRTRAVLRRTPHLRAPRNFTLSPDLARSKGQWRASSGAYTALRLASALASILLVIAVMGEWFAGTLQPAMAPVAQDVSFAPLPSTGAVGENGAEPDESFALPKEAPAPELELQARAEEPVMEAAAPTEEMAAMVIAPTQTEVPTPTLQPTETLIPRPTLTPEPEGAPPTRGWDLLRLLQISLAVVAVTAGAAAIYIRRSAERP